MVISSVLGLTARARDGRQGAVVVHYAGQTIALRTEVYACPCKPVPAVVVEAAAEYPAGVSSR